MDVLSDSVRGLRRAVEGIESKVPPGLCRSSSALVNQGDIRRIIIPLSSWW